MNFLEVALIILGVILFIAGFIIPEKKERSAKVDRVIADEVVKASADSYFSNMDAQLQENLDESVLEASNRLEREMEKISNEKLFSIGEYSETVLKDINKNHSEVMFLYDMLNDKQNALKELSVEVDAHLKQISESLEAIDELAQTQRALPLPVPENNEQRGEEHEAFEAAPKNRNELILSLHDEGYDNVDIARRLSMGVGEVNLIVDLFSA